VSLPIKARLTLWYVTLFALIVGFWSVFVIVIVRIDLYAGMDRALASRASQIEVSLTPSSNGHFKDISDSTLTGLARTEAAAQLLLADGTVVEHSGDKVSATPMVDPAFIKTAATSSRALMATILADGERFRILLVRVPGTERFILVGESTEGSDASLWRLALVMLFTGPLALLAAGAGGWFLAGRALRPVAEMTTTAASIGIDQLDERVPTPSGNDEIAALALTLNRMLERLEAGVRDKRRLVADASHELQTPLAVMRAELDVSLATSDLSPDAKEVLESTREEADRMTRIVRNLLTLARFDDGNLRLLRQPIDLADVAIEAADSLAELARENRVALTLNASPAPALGDPEYLRLVAINLVENALKYSGAGATVVIRTGQDSDGVYFRVSDNGPGIPAEAVPFLFDRFYRVDGSRSSNRGGSGLGLAIAKEIAEAHHGRITYADEPQHGACFALSLPAQAGRDAVV
jgi:signal transduction histidine kinase